MAMRGLSIALALSVGTTPTVAVSQQPDNSVFGIEIGKPLSLPECDQSKDIHQDVCVDRPIGPLAETEDRFINFVDSKQPSIVSAENGSIRVFMVNGKVAGFQFFTDGIRTQDIVISQLTEKYGKPILLERDEVKSLNGGSFQSVTAAWETNGLKVSFLGTVGMLTKGRVTIDTDASRAARREREVAAPQRQKL